MRHLIFIFTLLLSQLAYSTSEVLTLENYDEIIEIIDSKTSMFNNEELLVVFDIDHTLVLTDDCPEINQSLKGFKRFADSVKKCQAYLTSTYVPGLIYDLQVADYPVMALTARSKYLTDATLSQLQSRLRFTIEPSTDENDNKAELYFVTAPAYDTSFTEHDYKGAKKINKLAYKEGVALVGGGNKGHALQGFLKSINKSYKQIIFIDDSLRNIKNLDKAYKATSEHITIIHYTEFDRKKN